MCDGIDTEVRRAFDTIMGRMRREDLQDIGLTEEEIDSIEDVHYRAQVKGEV